MEKFVDDIGKKYALSEEQLAVIDKFNSNKGIAFLTGRAGSGKSTIIRNLCQRLEGRSVTYALLAPTGIAALNIGGMTIHRFFSIRKDQTIDNISIHPNDSKTYSSLQYLIIDEISMVRSDTLDIIDLILKMAKKNDKPFGGIPTLLVGDLFQLPPIVKSGEKQFIHDTYDSEFFFSSNVLKNSKYNIIELTQVYRQKDYVFIEILDAIRKNNTNLLHLDQLNKRFVVTTERVNTDFFITLCSTRNQADSLNTDKLSKINSTESVFEARIWGSVQVDEYPTAEKLVLKVGAQIMIVKNHKNLLYSNGTIGIIKSFGERQIYQEDENGENSELISIPYVNVRLDNGSEIDVTEETWDIFEPSYNVNTKKLKYQLVGRFTQIPLKLSWAVTIHKSQGQTFKNVILDIRGGLFASGQLYVGLSRCTSLDGLFLMQPIEEKHIQMNWRVAKYFNDEYVKESEKLMSFEAKKELLVKTIKKSISVRIKYVNSKNVISERTIKPLHYGKKEFHGKEFMALEAFDSKRDTIRTFQISRILNIINLEEIFRLIDDQQNGDDGDFFTQLKNINFLTNINNSLQMFNQKFLEGLNNDKNAV